MISQGFLGTRADMLMDVILLAVVLVPFALLFSFRKVRGGNHSYHKRMQATLFWIVLTAVVLFETNIRLSGGSGALIKESAWVAGLPFKVLLYTHILVAVLTFSTWGVVLYISGKKRKKQALPGSFTPSHKTIGKAIFGGSIFTAISGVVIYTFGFVM